jgi:hypothetical protein
VTPAEILTELEKLALRLGVPVRFELFDLRMAGKGGLCRLRGQPLILVDAGLPLLDKIGVLSEALASFDLEAIYVPPVLRARLESNRGNRKKNPRRGPVAPTLRGPAKAVRRVIARGSE